MGEGEDAAGAQGAGGTPAPDAAAAAAAASAQGQGAAKGPTVQEWFAGLDASLRTQVQAYVETEKSPLANALERQKTDNKTLRDDLAKAAETATGPLKQQLQDLGSQLESRDGQIAFLREAVTERVAKPDHLFRLAAQDDRAYLKNGSPDWKYLRTEYSYLFEPEKPTARGMAGAGTGGGQPSGGVTMDDVLRAAALGHR